eukprot:GHVU01201369.1.p2 GENE.GHVU01201369.1~~GHVU01201369.1.p2  ORF type:complete len:187 (+),score=26.31 GHVU01201369.1:362-922(+)
MPDGCCTEFSIDLPAPCDAEGNTDEGEFNRCSGGAQAGEEAPTGNGDPQQTVAAGGGDVLDASGDASNSWMQQLPVPPPDVDSSDCGDWEEDDAPALDHVADAEPATEGAGVSARVPEVDTVDNSISTIHQFSCSCPDYWHARVCYHIVLHQAVRGLRNLDVEVAGLPTRKKRGRPAKTKSALERQ